MNILKKLDKKTIKIIIISGSILAGLLLIVAGFAAFIYFNLSQIKDVEPNYMVELTQEPEETADDSLPSLGDDELGDLKVPDTVTKLPDGVYNVLMFGLDTRDKEQFNGSRSDVMLLITLDTKNKKIKLTSFMRDILVPIPGHSYNRINTAYRFGGPTLLLK